MTVVPTDRYPQNVVKNYWWTQDGNFAGGFYLYFIEYNYNDEDQQHLFYSHEFVGHNSGDYKDLAEFWKGKDQGVYDRLVRGDWVSRLCLCV